jgi:hypothetical protein
MRQGEAVTIGIMPDQFHKLGNLQSVDWRATEAMLWHFGWRLICPLT